MKLFNFKPRIRVHYTVCPNSVISEFSSNDCDLFKIAGDDKTLEQKLTCDNVEKSATNMVAFSRSDESLHAFNNEKATVFQNLSDKYKFRASSKIHPKGVNLMSNHQTNFFARR